MNNNVETRRRIGFRRQNEEDQIENKKPLTNINSTEQNANTFAISPAQADLIETINNLYGIILDESFKDYEKVQKERFVKHLINSVSLNAELTAKTNLLIS